MTTTRSLLTFLVLSSAGCACGATPTPDDDGPGGPGACSDPDGDGYGVGTLCAGPDCNESVPSIHSDEQCADYCADAGNLAPGCACDSPEPQICYGGDAATLGIGVCRGGLTTCEDGVWGPCDGQVLPTDEHCNETDDDCDGEVDDGVLSACGDCNPECEEDCVGVGCDDPFDPAADGATSVVQNPEGGITLDGESEVRNHVIWIANSGEGTVTKIDTREREETGRYDTSAGYGDPSRTTVNPRGDVVVANRGDGNALKFYASDCPDVDGDGEIETSTGGGDVYPFETDECWAWTTNVGVGARGSAFEVRIGLDGAVDEYVFVGDYAHMDIHEIESESGEHTGRVIANVNPYGLALGPGNVLWTFGGGFGGGNSIVSIPTDEADLEISETIPLPAGESWYGLTVDHLGRIWVGGSVARYDPDSGEWESPPASVQGGGIAVDGNGDAWVGEGAGAWFRPGPAWFVDGETLEAEEIDGGGGHGWAVDFDGYVWSVELTGNEAHCIDPDSLEEVYTFTDLVSAYTYSDMTGFQLVNATNPVGVYPHVFEACAGGAVRWADLTIEGIAPAGTSLGVAVKTANDLAALASAPLLELGLMPPSDGHFALGDALDDASIDHGNLLLVEVTLASIDRVESPILDAMHVTRSCEIGFE